MKISVVFATLVVAISAASDQDLWAEFKNKHGKTYKSLREEKIRFNIFQEELRKIESHNEKFEKGEVSYYLGINQFSDMTTEEFAKLLNENIATKPDLETTSFEEEIESNFSAPAEINWVEKGAVLGVKDQGKCGSCWAFSTTGAIEGQNFLKHNSRVALSEQQLVDCSKQNRGCSGGRSTWAFDYIKNNGLASEEAYPYRAVAGACKSVASAVKISGYVSVANNQNALEAAVGNVGPISVMIQADVWKSYRGGIFDNHYCDGMIINHVALAVGYGEDDGRKYWLIKNSWSSDWGEKGYIRLVRDNSNQCGITSMASYPKL